jgi:hypothetical protein
MTPPRLQRLDSSTSLVLPTELVALIFNNLGDYELATTLRIPHSLPTPSPWSEQATPLDQAILASSQSLTPILKALKMGHTDFTQWGARVMIRFSFIHCLDFFVKRDPRQLRQLCGQLLPVVASAWGRVDVLKWATESSFQLRPDAATTAEAMDDASRHGQVAGEYTLLEQGEERELMRRYSAGILEELWTTAALLGARSVVCYLSGTDRLVGVVERVGTAPQDRLRARLCLDGRIHQYVASFLPPHTRLITSFV